MKRTADRTEDEQPTAVGGAIRALRERLGLRQGDLAKRTGMSAAQLCHIEKDRNAPSVRTLQRIADALDVPLADLAAGPSAGGAAERPAPPEPEATAGDDDADFVGSLRPCGATSLADLPPAARAQVRRRILDYRELEKRAGVPTLPSLALDYPSEIAAADAEALAAAVRRAAGVADAILFDSVQLLENKGLRVVAADLPEGVDAFALWEESARNVWLMVRKAATDERQQFRAMCALADALRFVAGGARRPVGDAPADRAFAKAFAAAFLMPAAALRELCYRLAVRPDGWNWELLLREKKRYGVSAETFARRLEALELLRPSLRQEFARRARAWAAEHGGEPNPSHRKELRHSRFGDLKALLELR
ncbi:MAG: helix-turn-helix transcriptional regulator [Kiritimatiellae bacterium]|nr:helix-turn-helix transcriptional regulator [Kiritimatiellia bacterium]